MDTNSLSLLKKFIFSTVLVLSLLSISACSSPEDKANKFYENGLQLLEKGELVKANVEFRNALQLNQKMTKAIWGQVLVAEKQGDPREQFKLLNAVLLNEPEHLQALVKLGRLLLLAGQLDKSLEMSEQAMKINNQDLSVLSLRAAILLKLDDKENAVKLANQILAEDPAYIDALMILAIERLSSGDAQKAIEYLDKGLKTNSKHVSLQLIKIKALEELAEIDLAEDVFQRLINYYPKVRSFKDILAQFYLKHGRKNDAENIYRTIIKHNPNDFKSKITLVQFLNSTKGTTAGLNQLQTFSAQEPDNIELKFALVQFHLARKETGLANKILDKIIHEKAGTEAAIKAKGIMAASLLTQGNKETAENIINEILTDDKQNHTALILKSSINIDRQKYDEAIGDLRLVLRDAPNSSRALFFLAKAHNLSGAPELADEQFFKAFKVSQYNAIYGSSYAQFLLKRKQPKRAEKILENALSVAPRNLSLLKLLAQVRLSQGDWVGAQQVADTIKSFGGERNITNQIDSAVLVGKKEYSESITLLKKTYQSSPENIQPVVALVRTYLLSGKSKEAGAFLDAVIKTNPKNINAQILRGQIYFSRGEFKKAINMYESAINNDAKYAASYYYLSVVYMRMKKYDLASNIISKGLLVAPKDFSLRLTLAGLYEANGQTDKAINVYEALIKDKPDADIVANNLASLLTEHRTDKASFNKAYTMAKRFKRSEVPQFKDTFGWANYRLGKYKEAGILLESAIEQLPDIPDFHYHLGMNYLATKNKSMAREALEKAQKLAGDKPFSKIDEIRATLEEL